MYSFYTLLHTILFTSVSQVWVLQATCKELKTKINVWIAILHAKNKVDFTCLHLYLHSCSNLCKLCLKEFDGIFPHLHKIYFIWS